MVAEISFTMRATVPEHVLMRELDGEAVILNLNQGQYFGLDEVGTRMWQAVTTSPTIEAGYENLLDEYEVGPDELRHDLAELLGRLVGNGLLAVSEVPQESP